MKDILLTIAAILAIGVFGFWAFMVSHTCTSIWEINKSLQIVVQHLDKK